MLEELLPWDFSLALVYAALQTRWDYYAGHMFFVHRLQHFALHDIGPFLLAWSAPMAALAAGCGERWHRFIGNLRHAMSDRTRAMHQSEAEVLRRREA